MRDGGAALFIAENQKYLDKLLPFADRLQALNWIVVNDDTATFGYQHPKLRAYGSLLAAAGEPDLTWLEQQTAHLDADAPAFIVYTSGTTGAPKGALVTMASISRQPPTSSITIRHSRERSTARSAICRCATCSAVTSP